MPVVPSRAPLPSVKGGNCGTHHVFHCQASILMVLTRDPLLSFLFFF